tara:strand:- start:445 stop:849 length:405 start_codon:yes stop_codon:yes gene_type:complete
MADKIGVLGEATTATAATTTAYTVASGKGAKAQIMWKGLAHASNSSGDFEILVNGIVVANRLNMPAGEYFYSNNITLIHDPSASTEPDGSTPTLTCAPAPQIFWLSAGDTVQYTIGTDAMQEIHFQVVGVEVDV